MIKKLYGIVFLASFALLINCMEEELDQENRQQPLRWHILESWNNLTTIRNFQEYIDKDEDEGAIIQWITINKDTIQNDLPALLEIASFFKKQSVVAHILKHYQNIIVKRDKIIAAYNMDDIEQLKELLNFTSYLSDKDIFDAASLFVYLQSLKLGYDYSIIDKIVIAEGKNYQDPWGNRYLQDWILTREHNREGLLQFIEQTSPEELNATDKEQQTALHRVLQYLDAITEQDNERRHSELVCIIKNLIKHGADIEIENETGSKFTDSTFYQDNEDQVKKWQNTFVASQKTRKRLTLQRDKKRPSSMQSSQVAQQTKKFFTPINCMFMGLAAVAFFYAGCQLFGKKNIKATIKIKQVSV